MLIMYQTKEQNPLVMSIRMMIIECDGIKKSMGIHNNNIP